MGSHEKADNDDKDAQRYSVERGQWLSRRLQVFLWFAGKQCSVQRNRTSGCMERFAALLDLANKSVQCDVCVGRSVRWC